MWAVIAAGSSCRDAHSSAMTHAGSGVRDGSMGSQVGPGPGEDPSCPGAPPVGSCKAIDAMLATMYPP
jgi:hypothetical protein